MSFVNQTETSTVIQTETSAVDQTETSTVIQTETSFVNQTETSAVDQTETITMNSAVGRAAAAAVKLEKSPGAASTAAHNAAGQQMYVCTDFPMLDMEEQASADDVAPSSSIDASDSSIVCYDAAQPEEFMCTEYNVPVKEEVVSGEDITSQHNSETSEALQVIGCAMRELDMEIRRKELKISAQQMEMDRLLRQQKELKQLERHELKKLKLMEARTNEDLVEVGAQPVNYTLMRGKRVNSVIYVAESGHLYIAKFELYLQCCLCRYKGLCCPGKAKIAFNGYLVETRGHNHTVDHPDLLRRQVVDKVRIAIRNDETGRSIHEIFTEVAGASPYGHLVEFSSIRQKLQRDVRTTNKEDTLLESVHKRSRVSKLLSGEIASPSMFDASQHSCLQTSYLGKKRRHQDSTCVDSSESSEDSASEQDVSACAESPREDGSPAVIVIDTARERRGFTPDLTAGVSASSESDPLQSTAPVSSPPLQSPDTPGPPPGLVPPGLVPPGLVPPGLVPPGLVPPEPTPPSAPAGAPAVLPVFTTAQCSSSTAERTEGSVPGPPSDCGVVSPAQPAAGPAQPAAGPPPPVAGPAPPAAGPPPPAAGPAPPVAGAPPPRAAPGGHSEAASPPQTSSPVTCAGILGSAAPEVRRHLAFMLSDNNNRDLAIAFASGQVSAVAKNSLTGCSMQVDASFKLSLPVGGVFSRLMVVSLSARHQLQPGFLVLVRDHSRPVLVEVFRVLKRRLGELRPAHVVCASDPVLLAAAAETWPEARISCSVAQYCRAVLSQVVQEDLSSQLTGWLPVRSWLLMLLAVPFLPPNRMADALEKLAQEIPKDVDAETRQGLRKLCVYVTEEWLWKLGAAKLSAYGRPADDELDTAEFVRDLQSRYQCLRSAAGPALVAKLSRELDFWPFVSAVNEVLLGGDGALERGQAGYPFWPHVHLLEPLVVRLAADMTSQRATVVSFLQAAGAQLMAEGLPPGTGIQGGDAAVSVNATTATGASTAAGATTGTNFSTASAPTSRSANATAIGRANPIANPVANANAATTARANVIAITTARVNPTATARATNNATARATDNATARVNPIATARANPIATARATDNGTSRAIAAATIAANAAAAVTVRNNASAIANAIATGRAIVTGRPTVSGRFRSTAAARPRASGPGSGMIAAIARGTASGRDVLREVRIKLDRINGEHGAPVRRSGRRRNEPQNGDTAREADPLRLPEDVVVPPGEHQVPWRPDEVALENQQDNMWTEGALEDIPPRAFAIPIGGQNSVASSSDTAPDDVTEIPWRFG